MDSKNIPQPEAIYWGKRDAMAAEVSTPDFYEGAWLVQPIGAETWDAEGFATEAEAREAAQITAEVYGVETIKV